MKYIALKLNSFIALILSIILALGPSGQFIGFDTAYASTPNLVSHAYNSRAMSILPSNSLAALAGTSNQIPLEYNPQGLSSTGWKIMDENSSNNLAYLADNSNLTTSYATLQSNSSGTAGFVINLGASTVVDRVYLTGPTTSEGQSKNDGSPANWAYAYGAKVNITADPTSGGITGTPTIAYGGNNYVVGSRLNIVQSKGSGGIVTVQSVNSWGSITGINLTAGGQGYVTASGLVTTYPPMGMIRVYVGTSSDPATQTQVAESMVPYDVENPVDTEADLRFQPMVGQYIRVELQTAGIKWWNYQGNGNPANWILTPTSANTNFTWNVGEVEVHGFAGQSALPINNASAVLVPQEVWNAMQNFTPWTSSTISSTNVSNYHFYLSLIVAAEDLSYYLGKLTGYPIPIIGAAQSSSTINPFPIPTEAQTAAYSGTIYTIVNLKPSAPDYNTMITNENNGVLPSDISVTQSGKVIQFSGWPYRNVEKSVWSFLAAQGIHWVYPTPHGDYVPVKGAVDLSMLPLSGASISLPGTLPPKDINGGNQGFLPWGQWLSQTLRQGDLNQWRNGWNSTTNTLNELGGPEIPQPAAVSGATLPVSPAEDDYSTGLGMGSGGFNSLIPMDVLQASPFSDDNLQQSWCGYVPGSVTAANFENAFPDPSPPSAPIEPAYGSNIYTWLLNHYFINSSNGQVSYNLNSAASLAALSGEFTDPAEYRTILGILQTALSSGGARVCSPGGQPAFDMTNSDLISWVSKKVTAIAAYAPKDTSGTTIPIFGNIYPLVPNDASSWDHGASSIHANSNSASSIDPVPNQVPWLGGGDYQSGAYFNFINQVAAKAKENNPSNPPLIGALAYSNYFLPPPAWEVAQLSSNMRVQVVHYGAPNLPIITATTPTSPNYAFKQVLDQWATLAKKSGIQLGAWDYTLLHTDYTQPSPQFPVPLVEGIVDKAHYLATMGVGALDGLCQTTNSSYPYNPWNFYAYPRIHQNTSLTANQVENEFFTSYFKEAAAAMLAYYQTMETWQVQNNINMIDPGSYAYSIMYGSFPNQILYKMQSYLQEAQSAAQSWIVKKRVADMVTGFNWILAKRNLAGITVNNAGSGYNVGDVLTIDDGGSPVTLTVTAINPVISVSVALGGTGYNVGDFVSVSQSGAKGFSGVVTATGSGKAIIAISVTSGGNGYTTASGLASTSGSGSGATLNITVAQAGISSVTVNNVGSYVPASGLAAIGGNGTGASFNVFASNLNDLSAYPTIGQDNNPVSLNLLNGIIPNYISPDNSSYIASSNGSFCTSGQLSCKNPYWQVYGGDIYEPLYFAQGGTYQIMIHATALLTGVMNPPFQGANPASMTLYMGPLKVGTISNITAYPWQTAKSNAVDYSITATIPAGFGVQDFWIHVGGGSNWIQIYNITVTRTGPSILPAVSLTTDNSFYTAGATVNLTATASATTGANITSVTFYNGLIALATVTNSSPLNSNTYVFPWSSVSAGSYSLTAVATDSNGASTTSLVQSILVGNALNVLITNNGGYGEVFSTDNKIHCGVNSTPPNVCSEVVSEGTTITLTANATNDSTFSGWSDTANLCSGVESCTVSTSDTVTATFSSQVVAPSITTQPVTEKVSVGRAGVFSVVTTGTAPLAYQWYKNGIAVVGATNSSYKTPVTTSGNSGDSYTVKVSNSAGSQTSTAALLMVDMRLQMQFNRHVFRGGVI